MLAPGGLALLLIQRVLVQHVTDSSPERSPMANAIEWVSRITVIALEMVLPGLAGQWLDQRFGLSYLALVGFALGLVTGMWHLLVMTGSFQPKKKEPRDRSVQKEKP